MDTRPSHQDYLTLNQLKDMRIQLTSRLLKNPDFVESVNEIYAIRLKTGMFDQNTAKDVMILICQAIDDICSDF